MAMRLEVEGLSAGYPGEGLVCENISFVLAAGEVFGIIGPNGAGKSTLLRAVAGLLPLRSGRVRLDGTDLTDIGGRARARRIAVLPQELRAIPGLRVRAFVEAGRYPHRRWLGGPQESEARAVQSAMECAGVEDLAERLLEEISGGQRQRVLLARALAQDADLLLVDEPTSSLDPRHQLQTFDRLRGTTAGGRSAIVVTHDLNLASQYTDRLGLLSEGRLLAVGRPDEILRADVLEEVYGEDLHIDRLPSAISGAERPFVLPWRR